MSRGILFFSTALLFVFTTSFGKNKVDSLIKRLDSCKENDTLKVSILIKLGEQYDHFRSKEKPEYLIDAYNEAKRIQFNNGLIESGVKLVTTLSHRQNYDAAFEYCEQLITYLKANKLENNLKETYKLYAIILGKMGKYETSLKYNFIALNHYLSQNNKTQYGKTLSNISLLHLNNKQLDSAYLYSLRASEIFKELNLVSEYANSLLGLSEINLQRNDLINAKHYTYRALKMYNEESVNLGLVHGYYDLGNIFTKENKLDSAILAYNAVLNYLNGFSLPDMAKDCYKALADIYNKKGNYSLAYENLTKYAMYKDSVSDLKLKDKSLEMDVKFDIAKKENEIVNKENQIAANEKQRNYLILGIVAVVILLFVSYRSYLQKKKSNEIITEQKKLVDEKQKEILDSIQYAKRIQNTLLAHSDFINQHLPNNFLLFKPKDIVSGDFYWATHIHVNNKEYFYLAVCDSTGHGVPGAFMSLLNISFLNEAVTEKGIHQPNEIFNFVRQRLIDNISKEGQKDGFDGILICYEKNTNKISYSAANNNPVLITQNQIKELPCDKMPVGLGEKSDSFTMHSITLEPTDTLYLYTDGFADQFGGPKGKKFKYKQLNELILLNSTQSLQAQKENYLNTFNTWKGDLEQVDDVCLIGLKLTNEEV